MNTKSHYQPRKYFIILYAVTLVFWSIAAFLSYQPDGESIFVPFLIPGMMAPFAVTLGMILTSKSAELKKTFTDRLFNLKRIRPLTLLPIFLIVPTAIAVAAGISLLFGQSPDQFRLAEEFSFTAGAAPVLIILILAAAFEELGWRGYAFDSLNSRFNLFQATLIFALLWAAWHLPLFFINGCYQNEIVRMNPLFGVNFIISVLPMAFVLTWVWKTNRESIPVAILFHFFINLCQEAFQITQVTKSIETGVLILVAVGIVYFNRRMFFEKTGEVLS